jgi:cyclophilin family peptidyl-prolyl cis-trans isomerase
MRKIIVMLLMTAVAVTACAQPVATTPPTTSKPAASQPTGTTSTTRPPVKSLKWSSAPAMTIDTSKTYTATVDTSLGSFKIQLFANETPKTVNNFVFLANQGFYEGIIFHRVIRSFMIQTGDPTGTGSGDPGYKFADELPPKHPYSQYMVAMANSGPNTNGSQFFICTVDDSANLSPSYTLFGQVVEGMDVIQKIAAVQVGPGNSDSQPSRPVNPPYIIKITINAQ